MSRKSLSAGAAVAAAICALAIPAVASASSVYVSSSPVVANGKSCVQPNYNSIQAAIDAAATKINVCPGTYTEQLTITKAVNLSVAGTAGSAKVVLPASPANSKTACDEAPGTEEFQPDQDGISICTSGTVSISGLTLEAKWPVATCDDSLFGVLVAGGATLKATNLTVNGAGAFPINGCQGGVGIQVGMAWTKPVEVGHAALKGVTVTNYQKNGMTVDGAGSSANIKTTTVTGAGPTPETAQNGIQVSNGASASIKSSTISGNECDVASCGPDAFTSYQAIGVLFFAAAPGSSVTSSKLTENDVGAYYDSGSASQPSSPELQLKKDTFSSNRYEGVDLDQGEASLVSDKINGTGNIGIDLFQYEGQTLASQSSANGIKVDEMSEAAIKVESDKAAGDKPGKFTVTNSTFSGNANVLVNESSNFEVIF
jgi:parallel beta helix pectate lyase-like protein